MRYFCVFKGFFIYGGNMIDEIYLMLALYKSFTLALINDKGRILLNKATCLNDINIEKLQRKNENGNGIYFLPSAESNILFLDDLADPDVIPYQSIITRTSPGKHQAHILTLTRTNLNQEQRTKFQRELVRQFNADRGAISGMQPRRLPGFFNQKYPERPLVRIVKNTISNPNVPIFDVNSIKVEEPARKIYVSKNHNPTPKAWNDFYCKDFSSADMKYACYLARVGFTDAEIAAKLQNESPKISERKSGHVEDYLTRTIQKAHQFIS
jgi:hypothetical protein